MTVNPTNLRVALKLPEKTIPYDQYQSLSKVIMMLLQDCCPNRSAEHMTVSWGSLSTDARQAANQSNLNNSPSVKIGEENVRFNQLAVHLKGLISPN